MRHPMGSIPHPARTSPTPPIGCAQPLMLGSRPLFFGLTLFACAATFTIACSPASAVGDKPPDAGPGTLRTHSDAALALLPSASLLSAADASASTGGPTEPTPAPTEPQITDFQEEPVFADSKVPTDAPTFFGQTPRAANAPCIVSPEPNTLLPRNWLRPRFEFAPTADENLFEIELSVAGFAHALHVYARQRTYTMDTKLWSLLRASVLDRPITVKVRALTLAANGKVQTPPSAPATTTFTIAPVDAPGKIVYWAIIAGAMNGVLRGFGIGEENVLTVLESTQLVPPTIDRAKQQACIGCHSATPDGLGVGFSMGPPYGFRNSIADITATEVGQKPKYVTDNQLALVRKLQGIPSFSRSHWSDGDHIGLYTDPAGRGTLVWVNLDTDGEQGVLQRSGDSRMAVLPSFSHDGNTIAYVSGNSIQDGRFGRGPSDIFVVPFNNRAGGTATPVAGASDPKYTEYYPAFSPDDSYIAFARVEGDADSYSNKASEILVVPSKGGTATRFAANDPLACATRVRSPGAGNDWPKWSPDVTTASNGQTYYWVTFSSIRRGRPQLFLAPMTVKGGVLDTSYPALYLWNQPSTENNHTPSWDNYKIPAAPPPPPDIVL